MNKRNVFVFCSILVLALSFSFVSAGFFDFFKQSGYAVSDTHWTQWYDIDGPSGKGDFESLQSIIALHSDFDCDYPINIECRVVGSEKDYQIAGQNVVCDPLRGFYCINDENSKDCLDYEVRFLCGGEVKMLKGAPSSEIVLSGVNELTEKEGTVKFAPFSPGLNEYTEPNKEVNLHLSGAWTQWYDRDDPDQEGFDGYDDETIHTLNKEGHDICGGYEAIDVEVKNVETGANWSYSEYIKYKSQYHPGSSSTHYHDYFKHTGNTDNVRTINPSEGFLCKGDLGDPCRDYAIRFKCGDKKIDKPYSGGAYWTEWIDTDDTKYWQDDDETLQRIRNKGYDVCDGENPIDIQAKNTDSGATWTFSDMPPPMRVKEDFFKGLDNTDDIQIFSPTKGLYCNDVFLDPCRDYAVRFLCKGFFEEVDIDLGIGDECSNLNCDSIYAGPGYSCVIDENDEVCCWGLNDNGKLGTGKSNSQVIEPTQILEGKKFSELVFNREYLCGIDSNDELYCWGRTSMNRGLALSKVSDGEFNVLKFGLGKVVDVDSSESHLCAVTSSGELYCFGTNVYGQLAPSLSEEEYFGKVEFEESISDVALFSKDKDSSFGPSTAFVSQGKLYVYGGVVTSEVNGNTVSPSKNKNFISLVLKGDTPTRNAIFSNVQMIESDQILCALDSIGKISCFEKEGEYIYVKEVDFGNNVFVSLAVIGENVCGLTAGGEVYCDSDKLALGLNFQREEGNYYVYHNGNFNFESISASGTHVCGMTNTGNAYCWKSFDDNIVANMLGGSDRSEGAPLTKVDVCVGEEEVEDDSSVEEEVEEEIICTDGDGGKNYLVKGTTVAPGERDSPSTDVCTDLGYLREWYCYEHYTPSSVVGKMTYETINCSEDVGSEYICQNGACVLNGVSPSSGYFVSHASGALIYPEICSDDFSDARNRSVHISVHDEEKNLVGQCIGYQPVSYSGNCFYLDYFLDDNFYFGDEFNNIPRLSKESCQGLLEEISNLIISEDFSHSLEDQSDIYLYSYADYNHDSLQTTLDPFPFWFESIEIELGEEKSSCMGCKLNGGCYTFGFVKEGKYCSELNSEFVSQNADGLSCKENYECSSGICVGEKCVALSSWERFTVWFGKFFK